MKKLYVLLFLFLSQCMYTAPLDNEIIADPEPDTQVEETVIIQESNDDDDYRRRSEECEGDRDCEKICSKIFDSRSEKEECEEDYDVDQVEDMEEVFEILEKPDEDDLEDIDLNDLERILSISIEPVVDEAEKYSSSETRDFLAWLLNDDEAATLLFDEDDDYELLEALLGNLNNDPTLALAENIDGGDNFMEIATDEGNEEILEKVHDYLQEGGKDTKECSDDTCTFDKYCRMNLSRDVQEELLDFDFFEDFINDLIDDVDRNSDQADDLDDFNSLCNNGKYKSSSTGKGKSTSNSRNSNSRNTRGSRNSSSYSGTCTNVVSYDLNSFKTIAPNFDSSSTIKAVKRNGNKRKYTLTLDKQYNSRPIVSAIFKVSDTKNVSVNLTSRNKTKHIFNLRSKDTPADDYSVGVQLIYQKKNGECAIL